VRINDKCFLDYFLGIALAWANEEKFPFQFHTGFGDPSVFLRTGNPIMLRPALENAAYADVPFVLLHAGWPYVREASYLASVYSNVYVDAGLAIPFAASEFPVIWQQLLSLAPTSKVLWSSDGFILPEHCWFAAVQGRRSLAVALDALVELNAISEDDVLPIASAIVRDNAARLYRVGGDSG
jgi:predicted TIM-barrel fold metal-dependent hydrolase